MPTARGSIRGIVGRSPDPTLARAQVNLTAIFAALVLVAGEAPAASVARQELSIPMDDGNSSIAAKRTCPTGAARGRVARARLPLLHVGSPATAVRRTRSRLMASSARTTPCSRSTARGHGQSGGLVGLDGLREVADTRALRDWLAARPDVSDTRIGAWGISYGGGAALNSLVAGVPWAAVVAVETWTDLYTALAPQGLLKSGLVAGLAASIPESRRDLVAPRPAGGGPWECCGGAASGRRSDRVSRSSGTVATPVLIAQGRRDFLFGIGQGSTAFERLREPKALSYAFGLHGHTPSSLSSAADTGYLMAQSRSWFDTYSAARSRPIRPRRSRSPPSASRGRRGGRRRSRARPRPRSRSPACRRSPPAGRPFARPRARAGRSRPSARRPCACRLPRAAAGRALVAVLTARTPQGKELVVSARAGFRPAAAPGRSRSAPRARRRSSRDAHASR